MKVVLFCGGQGMRLRGAVGSLPKPMVPIGGRPLLWHIMRYYSHFGHRDFVVCVGHQANAIRDYFARTPHDFRIRYVDTGLDSSIGERFYAVRDELAGEDLPAMFRRLIAAGELVTYPYEGFWAPMDTLKDKQRLEALVASGGSVWQVWETPGPAAASG